VTIYVSDSYAPDDALTRRWARFLGGLVHGPELSGLTLYLAPPSEVARDCPGEAFGCYAPGSGQIEAIGDPSAGIPPEAVVAHEYGHYIASTARTRRGTPSRGGRNGGARTRTSARVPPTASRSPGTRARTTR